jgi:hypothetical protein
MGTQLFRSFKRSVAENALDLPKGFVCYARNVHADLHVGEPG